MTTSTTSTNIIPNKPENTASSPSAKGKGLYFGTKFYQFEVITPNQHNSTRINQQNTQFDQEQLSQIYDLFADAINCSQTCKTVKDFQNISFNVEYITVDNQSGEAKNIKIQKATIVNTENNEQEILVDQSTDAVLPQNSFYRDQSYIKASHCFTLLISKILNSQTAEIPSKQKKKENLNNNNNNNNNDLSISFCNRKKKTIV